MIKLNLERDLKVKAISSYQEKVNTINDGFISKNCVGNDYIGWINYPNKILDYELNRINEVAKRFIKDCEAFVVVSIGGSYLGSKAAIEALNGLFPTNKPEIYFLGQNLSPVYYKQLLAKLKGKKIGINVISKSGNTLETSLAFRVLKELAIESWGTKRYAKYVVITTDAKKGNLRKMLKTEEYDSFIVPSDIGGRYSVFTPVGLLPMAVAGINIKDFIAGAKDGVLNYSNPDLNKNDAYKYAVCRFLQYKSSKNVEMFITYEPHFDGISHWFQQLFGESEGKENKGLLPVPVSFSTDLHSLGQFCQEGSDCFFETTLHVKSYQDDVEIPKSLINIDNLNYLAGKHVSLVNNVAMESTIRAHYSAKRSNIVIEMDEMNAKSLGELFYFFMKACAVSAYLLEINPFNQPGVEVYKANMRETFKKIK